MARSSIVGLDCNLYINTTARADTTVRGNPPTWVTWNCIESAQLNLSFAAVQATCRGSAGFLANALTLGTLEITGTAVKTPSDPSYILMANAAFNRTVLDIAAIDGDRTGVAADNISGYRLDGLISQWNEDQSLTEVVKTTFTIVVARTSFPPEVINAPF